MKKAMFTLAAILIAFSSIFASAHGVPPPKPTKALAIELHKLVKFPQFAIEQEIECSVYVVVNLENDGSITVLKCDSANGKMREYVKEELSKLIIDDTKVATGGQHTLKITFDLL